MKIYLTLESETKNTVRFAEDEAGQSAHPGYPVVGTLYVQKAAHVQLGAPQRIAVTLETRE